jgi:poly-gamma-glutamate synthesis protein (capsule biosynthesis protein)
MVIASHHAFGSWLRLTSVALNDRVVAEITQDDKLHMAREDKKIIQDNKKSFQINSLRSITFLSRPNKMKKIIKIVLIIAIIFTLLQIVPKSAIAPEVNIKIFSGVVPHHLLAEKIINKFFISLAADSPETLILLSPDHFNQCKINNVELITASEPQIDNINVDSEIIDMLYSKFAVLKENSIVSFDHGISGLLPFIKTNLTNTKIVPVLVSQNFSFDMAKQFAELIAQIQNKKCCIIASVDFSHYLPKSVAELHDERSIRVLINFESENFKNIEVDSPQALFISRYFAELKEANSFTIVGSGNSQDFSEVELSETTSYFSAIFGSGLKEPLKLLTQQTFIFAGDIMFDRNVEKLMEKFGYDYPFEKIKGALRGVDFVVGNLEGPIVYNKTQYQYNSLNFSFDKKASTALSKAHFNVLSIANNHTDNKGAEGLAETRDILSKNQIEAIGGPVDFSEKFIYKSNGIIFTAFNFTYFMNDDVYTTVKTLRENSKEEFIITFLHWGNEYEETSSKMQQNVAHKLIDNGADLIIGSHPHVVQEVELYHSQARNKDALIFYSLGNFIMDQYFSKETQESLMVGLVKNRENLKFVLMPVKLPNSQPQLMNQEEKNTFLIELANRSSESLKNQIKAGVVVLNY